MAFANWDASWLKSADVHWQGRAPAAQDQAGVAVFCGYASFSKRTRVLVTVQNRADTTLCLSPENLITPSNSIKRRIVESAPALRARIVRAVQRTHLDHKMKPQELESNVSCRYLRSSSQNLPRLEGIGENENAKDCQAQRLELAVGDVFEASFDFSVPLVDLDEFEFARPQPCGPKPGLQARQIEVFSCAAR
jgi:hypothetical protein